MKTSINILATDNRMTAIKWDNTLNFKAVDFILLGGFNKGFQKDIIVG